MAEQKMEPVDAPASPPYSNGYIVQKDGEVVTLLFMRLPPAYTKDLQDKYAAAPTISAPVVASTTMTIEGAKTFMKLLTELLAGTEA
jgi:hypothetical protein